MLVGRRVAVDDEHRVTDAAVGLGRLCIKNRSLPRPPNELASIIFGFLGISRDHGPPLARVDARRVRGCSTRHSNRYALPPLRPVMPVATSLPCTAE